jgi:hypothetical protein
MKDSAFPQSKQCALVHVSSQPMVERFPKSLELTATPFSVVPLEMQALSQQQSPVASTTPNYVHVWVRLVVSELLNGGVGDIVQLSPLSNIAKCSLCPTTLLNLVEMRVGK